VDLKAIVSLLKDTFTEWSEDKASRLGAAVAFYTVFSLAPLLVVVIAVAGFLFGPAAVQGQIQGQIAGLVGTQAAQLVQTMIAGAYHPAAGIVATVLGLATLLLGATGLFGELQDALNTIWKVEPKPRGIFETVRGRVLLFAMVLVIAFLLLVSLVISAGLAALGQFLGNVLPVPEVVLHALNFVISFLFVTLLFALIYKVLPDAEIAWRDVWVGAAVTSLLFAVGKLAIGLYLGHSGTSSAYGAAGSLVVLLLWVYYSAQILFFGAEFTQLYARRYGSKVQLAPSVAEQMHVKDLQPQTEHTGRPAGATTPVGIGRRSGPGDRGTAARSERAAMVAAPNGAARDRNGQGAGRPRLAAILVAGLVAVVVGVIEYLRGTRHGAG
jgi:membrane protein